jgi:hypothetical protein
MRAALANSDWTSLFTGMLAALDATDAWIWAYVIFVVSNTMLPSQADRQSWRPVILFLLLAGVLSWMVGLGPAVVEQLSGTLITALGWLTAMYAFTIAVDVPFVVLIVLGEQVLERVKGIRVEYT